MPYYVIGEWARLRALRDRAELTQEDLAIEAGVTRNTVSNGELGGALRRSTVRKLARVLIVEHRELARWYDE